MKTSEIRSSFIEFFEKKGHRFAPPVPVAPKNDPTLLFINAGMNPFKPLFLGEEKIINPRLANSQKCIRVSGKHNDLEEVGRDTYHHTFFEMLGNWSFGDYYKKEAIIWSWELLTEVWGLPKDKLYATVYRDDDEAMELWKKYTDIDPDKVLKFDEKDNFWEMGATGPCGPCSEIHMDLGEELDPDPNAFVNSDSARYIEIWNLVFMQNYRDESGKLHDLENKHVDTGMGLERIASIIQGVNDNYKIDSFEIIRKGIEKVANCDWNENEEIRVAVRVIMDHIRTIVFSINDGVKPSNEGRGYVIRRILRRAFRYGKKLSQNEPFLYKIADYVVEAMGDYYKDLSENLDKIKATIKKEEERFNVTIDRGILLFDNIIKDLKAKNKTIIAGKDAFKLSDTFGFPIDLTNVMAEEIGFTVDMDGFDEELELQKEKARSASKFGVALDYDYAGEWIEFSKEDGNKFVGYNHLSCDTNIVKYMILDNIDVIVLKETPFYAESGGQLADKGVISGDGFIFEVADVQKYKEIIVHLGKFEGKVSSKEVKAKIEISTRRATAKNHTATHLLQSALKKIVSNEIAQAGSFNDATKLRFDFNVDDAISTSQLKEIELMVNGWILGGNEVSTNIMDIKEAKKTATALFEDKYGDKVRVVSIGNISSELCGGTHIGNIAEIGAFVIISESSVAAGIRRIEALTGEEAVKYLLSKRDTYNEINKNFKAPNSKDLISKVNQVVIDLKSTTKEVEKLKKELGFSLDTSKFINVKDFNVYVDKIEVTDKKEMKLFIEDFAKKNPNSIFAGIITIGKKASYTVVVGDTLVGGNYNAGKIIKEIALLSGGNGGGRNNIAQANIGDESKIDTALAGIVKIIEDV